MCATVWTLITRLKQRRPPVDRIITALPSLRFPGAVNEGTGAGHVATNVAPILATLAEQMPVDLGALVKSSKGTPFVVTSASGQIRVGRDSKVFYSSG
jgi:hypothetical protein